jgi:hypothetical protein
MNRTTRSGSGHTDAAGAWWASPYLLMAVALAGNLFLALASHHWPYADITNHLARYTLLDRYWFGPRPPYIIARLIPGPYMGIDLLGVALVHLFGAVVAMRALAALVVVAFPVGLWLLLDAVGRHDGGEDVRLWALAAVPLGIGWFAETSFMNFVIGVGALMACVALWWPAREHASTGRLVAIFVASGLLFLIHLSAPLMLLVIVWTDWLFAGPGHRLPRLRTALVVSAGVLAATIWWKVMVPPAPHDIHTQGWVTFKAPWIKLRNFLTPFFVFSFPQMAVTLGAYVVAVVLFLRTNRPDRRWNTLAWCVGAFFLLYLIFPSNTPGTGYTDARWLMPMYLLPFAAAWHGGRRPSTRVALVLVACALLNAATLWAATRRIDRELDDYATVLDGLPPGRRVLPLVADSLRHGLRIAPYRHFAFWYQIQRGGRVPSLFNYSGDGGNAPRQTFMSHFEEIDQLYTLPPQWGTTVFTPLDWTAIDRDYDYIVVAGRDPRVLQMLEPHARQLTRVGDITVFQPSEPPIAASPTSPSGGPVAEPSGGGTTPHARQGAVP